MNENNIDNIKSQMRKGVLEYCILSVLDKNDAYASELINKLKDARIIVVEGTLYPLLTRQKNQGLLTYRWEESTQGPPRKYYSLTNKGRDVLQEMDKAWKEIVETLDILRK
ncbi:MAG: PadR family transcriptional regulator [Bacteroidales bacterium]|jgi:PadR family transcriptional regulator PadR|nr:PadR family transcriptional regulator [Bacteroidales bacterium]